MCATTKFLFLDPRFLTTTPCNSCTHIVVGSIEDIGNTGSKKTHSSFKVVRRTDSSLHLHEGVVGDRSPKR